MTSFLPAMPTHDRPSVICAGLSCLDVSLHNTRPPETLEQITPFTHTSHSPGGSAPQTALALTCLNVPTAVLTLLGNDSYGKTLIQLLADGGVDTSAVAYDASTPTSLSILPVFTDGRRGCFVTLGANNIATPDKLLASFETVDTSALRVFHFGYPHLMPNLQGEALVKLLTTVRARVPGVRLSLDLNGAQVSDSTANIVSPALPMLDFLHANLEEACTVTGIYPASDAPKLTVGDIEHVVGWFTQRGTLVVAITAGKDGVFLASRERGVLYRSAFRVSEGVVVNASGAGDAFVAGVLAVIAESDMSDIVRLADAGLVSALRRIEPSFGEQQNIAGLLELAKTRSRIPPRAELQVGHGAG